MILILFALSRSQYSQIIDEYDEKDSIDDAPFEWTSSFLVLVL